MERGTPVYAVIQAQIYGLLVESALTVVKGKVVSTTDNEIIIEVNICSNDPIANVIEKETKPMLIPIPKTKVYTTPKEAQIAIQEHSLLN